MFLFFFLGKPAKNGGQIAKEYLKSVNINTNFNNCKRKDSTSTIVRRAKKRCFDVVSVPTDVNVVKLKDLLAEKIVNGEYTIGKLVVPKTYRKLVLKDGIVDTELFTLESRKIDLAFIRKKLLEKHEKFMRCFDSDYQTTNSEIVVEYLKGINEYKDTDTHDILIEKFSKSLTTRHIQLWHDASALSNHGFILFTVNVLYDPAVYYSDKEYEHKSGKIINIQSEVEKPHLYIIGRCKSNDEQLAYIETRTDCLKELNEGIEWKGIIVSDTMRVFHGDGPAAQLEAGQQKGGHHFCPTCGIHASRCNDVAHCYYLESFTYKQRYEKVMDGKISKSLTSKQKFKPLENLSLDHLKIELKSRELSTEGNKRDLHQRLKNELKGMIRVPALCYHDPSISLQDLNLNNYEIATVEPMHDIAGEIVEKYYFPAQLSNETKLNKNMQA